MIRVDFPGVVDISPLTKFNLDVNAPLSDFISTINVVIINENVLTFAHLSLVSCSYPIYQLGNPQMRIFRPTFSMTLVRPGKPQPQDTVQFRISME